MSHRDAVHYHKARATEELDRGISADSSPVAQAHLQLASLHMLKLRELGGDPDALPATPILRVG